MDGGNYILLDTCSVYYFGSSVKYIVRVLEPALLHS
jgi:hypothetical protein